MTELSFYAELSCQAINASDASFKKAVKVIIRELDKLDQGKNALVSSDGAEHVVTFGLVLEAAEPMDALSKLSSLARTALHASGGATPNWPSFTTVEISARESATASPELTAV